MFTPHDFDELARRGNQYITGRAIYQKTHISIGEVTGGALIGYLRRAGTGHR
jgi:hypothetical protein